MPKDEFNYNRLTEYGFKMSPELVKLASALPHLGELNVTFAKGRKGNEGYRAASVTLDNGTIIYIRQNFTYKK